MITYNDLYEALRKEKYSKQLQQLPKNFVQSVSEYLKEKKEILSKDEGIFSDAVMKTKKQFENAIAIFSELKILRRKKLLDLAFVGIETGISKRDFENMTDFEKIMFDKVMQTIDENDKSISDILNGKKEKLGNAMVVFKEDVEEFLGFDGKSIGPFKKGELANMPSQIVKILSGAGKVELAEEG